MPAERSKPPTPPEGARWPIKVGRYDLVLGDPAGATLVPLESSDEPSELARAIAQARAEGEPPQRVGKLAEDAIADVAQVADQIDHAANLFTKFAQGSLDAEFVSKEVDTLAELLGRLDREGRWQEVLRLARVLAMLLALLQRWLELIESLRAAARVAEQLGDESARAWALHELGTLHLAAERLPDADTMLSSSRECETSWGTAAA